MIARRVEAEPIRARSAVVVLDFDPISEAGSRELGREGPAAVVNARD